MVISDLSLLKISEFIESRTYKKNSVDSKGVPRPFIIFGLSLTFALIHLLGYYFLSTKVSLARKAVEEFIQFIEHYTPAEMAIRTGLYISLKSLFMLPIIFPVSFVWFYQGHYLYALSAMSFIRFIRAVLILSFVDKFDNMKKVMGYIQNIAILFFFSMLFYTIMTMGTLEDFIASKVERFYNIEKMILLPIKYITSFF